MQPPESIDIKYRIGIDAMDAQHAQWIRLIERFRAAAQAAVYRRVAQTLAQMKGCLAAGHPFVFGFSVYESFESPAVARSGRMPMPAPSEKSLGGHAVLAVGYDDARQVFIVMNSWSERWGDKGCFYMLYAYLADGNLADDLWVVTVVEV